MTIISTLPVLALMLISFLVGAVAFKRTNRWCPRCGGSTCDLRATVRAEKQRVGAVSK